MSEPATPPSDWNVTTRDSAAAAPESRGFIRDFLRFAWEEKWWWIVPSVLVFAVLGFLLVAAQGGQVAPFFYALF
ncbi:MAG: hypothetical protein FJ293_12175 [Planctomycetes bacterium]|nr:hypothetical protein [Planctomycetota bacterium]